jgi:hypothetical protein
MKMSKHASGFALAGSLLTFGAMAHAGTLAESVTKETSNPANIPLVIFILGAIMVYYCNRPRPAVHLRLRRRADSSHHTPH